MFYNFKYDPFKMVSSYPLALVRILFSTIMLISIIRFWLMGWIEEFYINPSFHFSYYGFDWVKFPGTDLIYLFFAMMIVSLALMMLGKFFKISASIFFILFTYVELLDKSLYLNHYYFISIISFLMILVPADACFSLSDKKRMKVPAWAIDIFKFQLIIVYFMAGIAKLNYDWLINAMPLKLWLPANSHLPIIGSFLKYEITSYLFSWAGALYDLSIWIFLLIPRTRKYAYFFVFTFHLSTAAFFNIGMFPYIMSLLSLVFLDPTKIEKVFLFLGHKPKEMIEENSIMISKLVRRSSVIFLTSFALFQVIYPFRHLAYDGDLFWHEQGYRFGWRVMLMEKAGACEFKIVDNTSGNVFNVSPSSYLNKVQETQMSTQADMILQFAHYLKDTYQRMGYNDVSVYADSYVSLNGSGSKRFIDPNIDLTKKEDGFEQIDWILSYK